MAVYPPGTTFTTDAEGFPQPQAGSTPTQIIVDGVPRNGETVGGDPEGYVESWDSRDSSGSLVSNGLYTVYAQAIDPSASPTERWAGTETLAVDILRFTSPLTTTGISPTNSVGTISYALNANATVRLIVALPGRLMTIDGSGNVQPLDPTGTFVDTTAIVQTFSFVRGAGNQTETWNGTNYNGVAVSSGLYTIGISAQDGSGNWATDTTGNNYFEIASLPVSRSASQTGLNTTPPTITQVTVNGSSIALTGDTVLTGSFSTIAITLNATAGSGSDLSQVSLSGPNGLIAGGSISASGDVVTYSTGTLQSSTGTYTLNVTAEDVDGNVAAPTSYNFTISLPTPPSVTVVAVNGSTISLGGGSILSGPVSSVAVTLNESGGTGVNQSSVTLTSPSGGAVAGTLATVGNVLTFTPTTAPTVAGNYSISVIAKDVNGNASNQLNYGFSVAAPTPPSITAIAVNGSTISLSGGSILTGSFSSIAITLSAQGGTGVNQSSVTLTGPHGSVPGSVSTLSNIVTFSTGTEVSSGTYTLTVTAENINGTIASPVSITFNLVPITIAFSAFSTTGITPNGPAANINYTIGSNATVRILIAQPGRQVVDDGNGNVQSLNATGNAIDYTTMSVVQVFTVPVSAGANVTTWNGTNSLGVPVPAGLYTVGVSAVDSFGDESTNLTGAVAPLSGTIAVNRTANQGAGNTTPPTVTQVAVNGSTISLTGGTVLTSPFSAIALTLSATAGTGTNQSQVTLVGPNGIIQAGSVSSFGSVVTFSTGTESSYGTYTVNIIAVDVNGNISAPTSFNFTIAAPPAPSVTGITVNASTISLTGETTLIGSIASIAIALDEAGGTSPQSLVTLTGPSGAVAGSIATSGSTVTFTPSSAPSALGTYTISIVAENINGLASTLLSYSFTLVAPPPPTINSVSVGGSTISLSGGSIVTGSFNSIAIALSTPAGTGANLSVVTLSGPYGVIVGSVTASSNIVTFSTGTQTSTGTYTLSVTAKDTLGDTAAPLIISFNLAPITIAFSAFSTTGITPNGPAANINYAIGSNATVRILIAQPGHLVVDDGNGNVQALNATGTAIDSSTNSVVQVFTLPVSAGANVTTWNGTNSLGVPVPAGLYTVGLSAVDAFGHESTNLSGAVAPVSGTISVNRTANQGSGNTTPPTVTQIAVNGSTISLTGGTILTGSFSSIALTLSATAGTGTNQSQVTVVGPNGAIPGSLSSVGAIVTFSTGTEVSTGTYTVSVIAVDVNGNIAAQTSYNFSLGLPTPPSVSAIAVNGSTISLSGGTSISGSVASVTVTLNETGGTGANSSIVTLTGPSGAVAGSVATAGSAVTFTPTTAPTALGSYTLGVTAKDVNGNASSPLIYSFNLTATPPPSVTAVAVSGSTITLTGGSFIAGSFNTITVTLSAAGGTGIHQSTVTLTSPSNGTIAGALTTSGNILTYVVGTQSSTGTYTVGVIAQDNNGDVAAPASFTFTLTPVTVHFSAFSTTGITPGGAAASISYTISANATVRILIAQPGRTLIDDGSGNVQTLDANGTAIDTTTNSVVAIFSVPVTAGSNATSWNGTNENGVPVPSGLYSVGISALDSFGDQSTNLSGVVGPVTGTVAVNRTAGQGPGNTTPPSATAVTVNGSSIALTGAASVLSGGFQIIQITLSAPAGTGPNVSTVTLSGPGGLISSGTVTSVGDVVTYTAPATQTSTGTYTINMLAVDVNGNIAPLTFTFALTVTPAPTVASVAVNSSTVSLSGASVITGTFTVVSITLSGPSGTGMNQSSVTVTNPSGNPVPGTVSVSGNVVSFTVSGATTAGTYTVHITPENNYGATGTVTSFSFILVPATSSGSSGGSGGTTTSTTTASSFGSSVIPYPNPARAAPSNIQFTLPAAATVTIDIYTVLGRRVFHMTQSYGAGTQTYPWQLVNDAKSVIANGVYLVQISANDGTNSYSAVKKIMVIR